MSINTEPKSFPLISIVTPAYNAMPYLESTIKSVLAQRYPKLQHIVFDGASTDNSMEVLKKYAHLFWVSEKDNGQSHALNKGFAKAEGDIIGWLNADDTYTEGTFEKVVRYFDAHPETDLIGTDINIIDENDSIIGFTKSAEFDLVDLLNANRVKQPTVFMRRAVIDKLKGVDESLHYVMDQEFWLRVGLNGFKFDYLPGEIFANFRLIRGTKTFESGLFFRQEWHDLISKEINHPYFSKLSAAEKEDILSKSRADIHFQKMMQEATNGNRRLALASAVRVAVESRKMLANFGFYKMVVKIVLGQEIDKIEKFRKNESERT